MRAVQEEEGGIDVGLELGQKREEREMGWKEGGLRLGWKRESRKGDGLDGELKPFSNCLDFSKLQKYKRETKEEKRGKRNREKVCKLKVGIVKIISKSLI